MRLSCLPSLFLLGLRTPQTSFLTRFEPNTANRVIHAPYLHPHIYKLTRQGRSSETVAASLLTSDTPCTHHSATGSRNLLLTRFRDSSLLHTLTRTQKYLRLSRVKADSASPAVLQFRHVVNTTAARATRSSDSSGAPCGWVMMGGSQSSTVQSHKGGVPRPTLLRRQAARPDPSFDARRSGTSISSKGRRGWIVSCHCRTDRPLGASLRKPFSTAFTHKAYRRILPSPSQIRNLCDSTVRSDHHAVGVM